MHIPFTDPGYLCSKDGCSLTVAFTGKIVYIYLYICIYIYIYFEQLVRGNN